MFWALFAVVVTPQADFGARLTGSSSKGRLASRTKEDRVLEQLDQREKGHAGSLGESWRCVCCGAWLRKRGVGTKG
jgi:hypothetical protein